MTNIWLGTGRIDRRAIPRAKDALGMTGGFIGWRRELGFRDSANRRKTHRKTNGPPQKAGPTKAAAHGLEGKMRRAKKRRQPPHSKVMGGVDGMGWQD